jgi:hypothetical protein
VMPVWKPGLCQLCHIHPAYPKQYMPSPDIRYGGVCEVCYLANWTGPGAANVAACAVCSEHMSQYNICGHCVRAKRKLPVAKLTDTEKKLVGVKP